MLQLRQGHGKVDVSQKGNWSQAANGMLDGYSLEDFDVGPVATGSVRYTLRLLIENPKISASPEVDYS